MNSVFPSQLYPWTTEQYLTLVKQYKQKKLAHGWLIQGQPGLGKMQLALHFVHYLLCDSPENSQPCEKCKNCKLLEAGNHPDIKIVEPDNKTISVNQIRETIEYMQGTSQQGGVQCVIINPSEAMNSNAANALLKVLEEPGAATFIFLISHQPALLMPTVRSRCQNVKVLPPQKIDAAAWLESCNVRVQPETLLRLANGAPLKALQLADEDALHERTVLHSCLERMAMGQLHAFDAVQECSSFNIQDNLNGLMLAVSDLISRQQAGANNLLHDSDLQQLATLLADKMKSPAHIQHLHTYYQSLIQARKAVSSTSNPNPQLLLEALLYRWETLTNPEVAATGTRL